MVQLVDQPVDCLRATLNLSREISQNIEFGYEVKEVDWSLKGAIYYRFDNDLVDWTYDSNNPNSRLASNVDIETFGLEIIAMRKWGKLETE